MKAHLPVVHTVRPNRNAVREAVHEELNRQENDRTRQMLKLLIQAMYESKISRPKIAAAIEKFSEISAEKDQDEVFWSHIDRNVIEKLKFEFQRENYEEVDK